jgi:hypothetical protein
MEEHDESKNESQSLHVILTIYKLQELFLIQQDSLGLTG